MNEKEKLFMARKYTAMIVFHKLLMVFLTDLH